MSDAERTPAPRRSTREKKQSQKLALASPSKRKRTNEADDDQVLSDLDMFARDDSDGEDDYVAPRKPKAAAKGKAKAHGPPAAKKARATKPAAARAKTPTRRGRKPKGTTAQDTAKTSTEAKIAEDNALFNSIMNPAAALQSTVEDYLESFQQSPEPALADLINCVLRACGSNNSVDADRAVDYDGIVDALDDFTEVLKEENAPTYPLTSKHPMFKKFRKSLSEFLTRLVQASAELGVLYTSDLLMTIQAWVVAMSSSQLRSFRHTATVIALEIETALCDVAAAVEKEAEVITRQREGERKRKGKGASTGREKEFEAKAVEVKERRAELAEFLKEFFDGVFVHRYRDLDPNIRAECVHALGDWLKKFPAHYLDGQYLRYIGWVLSDVNTHVRLEAVKALVALYAKDDFIVSLQSFTERFKPRLVEMATGDTELAIRVTVVQVLGAIDAHGLLDEEQRAALCLLVFDADMKVRRAVSSFVRGVWEETVEQRLVGKKHPSETERDRAGLKALAHLLVQWGRALDRTSVESGEDLGGEGSSLGNGTSTSNREVSAVLSSQQKGRISLAVEALWDEVSAIGDWEAMLELLLLDHSAGVEASNGTPVSARRKKTKKAVDDSLVDEAWRLDEAEEAILLEVLVAALRKSKAEAASGKKGEGDTVVSEITRELIKSLPSLIAKHQTDENRIANVLMIPELMNIDMYLEMRMITAYESLWDDVIKQFLTHTSAAVLANSIAAIRHLMDSTSLSNTNSTKVLELEDELASSLRDAVGGRDELEVATFSEDEAHTLGAICARLCALAGSRDMTAWMEEDEGGKQSSAWDIVCALAERGRLGYKEEEVMVDRSLQLLTLHVIWKARNYMRSLGSSADEEQLQEATREQRDVLLEKLVEYAIGTQSNTLLSVKQAAFQNLLTLYILFSPGPEGAEEKETPLAPLSLSMSDEIQYRCAGFVQAEIERYAEELEGERPERGEESDAGSDSGEDTASEAPEKKSRAVKGKKKTDSGPEVTDIKSKSQLEEEYIFNSTMATFLRALRAGVIHVRHGAILLAHYGRLGPSFDLSSKLMVDILREEGMYKDNGKLVVEVVVEALKESFTLVLDRVVETEQNTLALAKALAPCLLMRGAQLSVLRKLPSEHVVEIHTTLVSWITKKISAYKTTKNKRGRTKSILFFRVLLHLLTAIEPRDALKIKAHLDQDIAMLNIEIPPSSKAWEPYRAYEKRLITATTKEKGAPVKKGGKGKDAAAKSADYLSSEDEEVEGPVETNGISSQPPAPKVRPRPAYRKEPSENGADEVASQLTPLTEEALTPEPPSPQPLMNGAGASLVPSPSPFHSSPATTLRSEAPHSKKRARSPEAEGDSAEEDDGAEGGASAAATQASEFIVRRKRVRH